MKKESKHCVIRSEHLNRQTAVSAVTSTVGDNVVGDSVGDVVGDNVSAPPDDSPVTTEITALPNCVT